MTISEIMFALVQTEMNETDISSDILNCLNDNTLSELYKLSSSQDIAHIVGSALSRGYHFTNDALDKGFESKILTAVYRYEHSKYALQEICEILETAKVPYIPLKGSVLREYYPQPWMRTSCDIDVLVHKNDVERAIKALCDAQYVRDEDVTTHDCPLISPSGVRLELHYSLEQGEIPTADNLLQSVWDSSAVKEGSLYRYDMCNEMVMLYHIAHMAKHFILGGCGVRTFIDLWLLNKKMPFDTQKLQEMLSQSGLAEFYKETSKLSDVWMDNQAHDDITFSIEKFVMTGGLYGSASNSASVKAAKGEGRVKTFLKLLFLPRKSLEIIYPKLKKYPILFPFYQVKRWFRVFSKKRRKRISNVMTARSSVQKDKQEAVTDLLSSLKLK